MASLLLPKTSTVIANEHGRSDEPPLILDWNVDLERPKMILAYDYWRSRRGTRRMPSRTDLDPVGMRKFVAHIGLIEIRRDPELFCPYFVRLAGAEWQAVYGQIIGKFFFEFLPPHVLPSWRTVCDAVRDKIAPLRIRTTIHFEDKRWLTSEALMAPLGDRDDEASMLFLAFDAWTEADQRQQF